MSSTMPAANDLRRGMAIKYNGNAAIVLEVHHRTPGNLRAFVQAIIRYINTGKSADVRFGSTDKVELVEIERKQLEFSYKDRNGYHFMDPETYDTVTLQENLIGDAKDYLVENLSVQVLYAEGKPVEVELPASVSLKVVESPEGLRGDTASNVTKPAKLETGKTINVPLFIKEGETIKIDTRTGGPTQRLVRNVALARRVVPAFDPLTVPTRWVKFVFAIFLLPICAILSQTFFTAFARATVTQRLWAGEEFWFFSLGAILWLIAFLGLPRPIVIYVFGHELTHALWVLLMGGRVSRFRVGRDGGHVVTNRHNFGFALA